MRESQTKALSTEWKTVIAVTSRSSPVKPNRTDDC